MNFLSLPFEIQQAIVVLFILFLFLSVLSLFLGVFFCKNKWFILCSSFVLLLSFLSVFLAMRGSYLYRENRPLFEASAAFLRLPLWFFILLLTFLLLSLVFEFLFFFLWKKKHLSPLSIKESFDGLPMGVCFYEENGLVRLSNKRMDEISLLFQKESLLNASSFWGRLERKEIQGLTYLSVSENEIITQKGNQVFLLHRYPHLIGRNVVYEINETNITEIYELTKEVEQKAKELQAIQANLLSYRENIKELITEKEILQTKIRIHDDLGNLLLITKEKLKGPLSSQQKSELLSLWRKEIEAFLANKRQERKDDLLVLEETAKLIGVRLVFQGKRPEEGSKLKRILLQGVHESLTNAVKHAGATLLLVTVKKKGERDVIEIRNDGLPPKRDIQEGGGLSSLRKLVENNLGEMEIVNQNGFLLRITV